MPWILFTRKWLALTAVVLLVSGVCVRLGVWQLDRLAQRRAANAQIAYATSLPAAVLPGDAILGDQEYRPVRAQGVYDFSNQVALRNQALGGQYGYHLVTPLLMQSGQGGGKTTAVLVDRGWIPADGNQLPSDWRKYDVLGAVSVDGVVRAGDAVDGVGAPGHASALEDQTASKFVLIVDPGQVSIQAGYPLEPFYIEATSTQDASGPPVTQPPSLDLSNGPHLGYAIQWFAFALIIPVGFAYYVRRQEAGSP